MVYGGEHYGILPYDDDDEGTAVDPRGGGDPSASFEIRGAGSGLIDEFLGFAGLHQMLVTPKLDPTLLSDLWSDGDAGEEETISMISIRRRRKRLLLNAILENSLLTDSAGMLGPKTKPGGSWVLEMTGGDGGIASFTVPPLGANSAILVAGATNYPPKL